MIVLKRLPRVAIAAVLCASAAVSASAQQPRNPEQMGPYPVGVTTMQLDDKARMDPELSVPRPLRTEIWYPAVDAARNMRKQKYSEFIAGLTTAPGALDAVNSQLNSYKTGLTVAELDKTWQSVSVRDVEIRGGKWPLVVFSHGSGGTSRLRLSHRVPGFTRLHRHGRRSHRQQQLHDREQHGREAGGRAARRPRPIGRRTSAS
jgi:hypothetical protein